MSLNEWKNNELNNLLLKKFGILKEGNKPDIGDIDKDGDKKEDAKDAAKDAKKGEKKSSKPKKGEVPPQLQKHVKGKKEEVDESNCLGEEEIKEGRMHARTTNADKFVGHEDRYRPDRIHEADEEEGEMKTKDSKNKKYNFEKDDNEEESKSSLQEAIKKNANAKKIFLKGKRIK